MDHKQFRKQLCDTTGLNAADVDSMIEGLAVALRKSCSEMDSVAIPTFGTFRPVKHNEEIVNDLSTGKRMLLPPEITVEFDAGAMLLKRLNPSQGIIE